MKSGVSALEASYRLHRHTRREIETVRTNLLMAQSRYGQLAERSISSPPATEAFVEELQAVVVARQKAIREAGGCRPADLREVVLLLEPLISIAEYDDLENTQASAAILRLSKSLCRLADTSDADFPRKSSAKAGLGLTLRRESWGRIAALSRMVKEPRRFLFW